MDKHLTFHLYIDVLNDVIIFNEQFHTNRMSDIFLSQD